MGSFWTSFFEHLKECGRNATLFLVTLAVFSALLALGVVLYVTGWYKYVTPALPFLAVLIFYRIAIGVRKARAQRRLRTRFGPLSDIELRRARAKLRKDQTSGQNSL